MKHPINHCIPEHLLNIQQLTKLEEDCHKYDIYPIALVQSVFDKSGIRLDTILSSFNYVFLPYNGTKEDTRLQVPLSTRRKSLVICYRDTTDELYIEMYNFDKIDDDSFKDSENWVDFEQYVRMVIEKFYKDYIDEVIGNLRDEINEKLDSLEEEINKKLDELEQKIEDTGDDLEEAKQDLEDKITEVSNNVTNLEVTINNKIEDLNKDLSDQITEVSNRVTNLETNCTEIDNRVTTLEGQYKDLEARLIAVEQALTLKTD